jgi:hypothetical protein
MMISTWNGMRYFEGVEVVAGLAAGGRTLDALDGLSAAC